MSDNERISRMNGVWCNISPMRHSAILAVLITLVSACSACASLPQLPPAQQAACQSVSQWDPADRVAGPCEYTELLTDCIGLPADKKLKIMERCRAEQNLLKAADAARSERHESHQGCTDTE